MATPPGPGLRRMATRMGTERAEALRQQVLRDQAAALAAASGTRPAAEGDRTTYQSYPPTQTVQKKGTNMTTRKELTDQYNKLALEIGRPPVKSLFRTLGVAQDRVLEMLAHVAAHHDAHQPSATIDTNATAEQPASRPESDSADPLDIPFFLRVENQHLLQTAAPSTREGAAGGQTAVPLEERKDWKKPKSLSWEEWDEWEARRIAAQRPKTETRSGGLKEPHGTKSSKARASTSSLDPEARIVPLGKKNPCRPGGQNHAKFATCVAAGTIGAALAAGIDPAFFPYGIKHKMFRIEQPKKQG